MLDLTRYKGPALVLSALGALLVLADLAIGAALGTPEWLIDPHAVDWTYYDKFGSQVAGAQWQADEYPEKAPERFGLLIGASTIQRGPLPALVQEETGQPWLLLGVGGGTGGFSKLRRSIHVITDAGLRPDTVVLGVHGIWLASAPDAAEEGGGPLDWLWFVRHQRAASNFAYAQMQAAREQLFADLGQGTWAAFTPSARPWSPPPEMPFEAPLPEARLEDHRAKSAKAGRFDAASYDPESHQRAELAALIGELQALSKRVVVVVLPERSAYRSRVPEIATTLVVRTASNLGAEVLDLRDALPDAQFWDNYHLTMDGRRALSALLASKL